MLYGTWKTSLLLDSKCSNDWCCMELGRLHYCWTASAAVIDVVWNFGRKHYWCCMELGRLHYWCCMELWKTALLLDSERSKYCYSRLDLFSHSKWCSTIWTVLSATFIITVDWMHTVTTRWQYSTCRKVSPMWQRAVCAVVADENSDGTVQFISSCEGLWIYQRGEKFWPYISLDIILSGWLGWKHQLTNTC